MDDVEHREERGARSTLGTVRNATLILELLSEGPSHHSISELAQRSGLALATLHRLLRSLALAGLVEQDAASSRYGLGPQVLRLAGRYLSRLPALRVLAPYLVELRNALGATIQISLLVGEDVVRVDRVDGADVGVFREPHVVEDALASAAGRVLLSRAPEVVSKRVSPNGDRSMSAKERRQWATAPWLTLTVGDQVEVAVPVLDCRERPVAALSAQLPAAALSPEAEECIAAQLLRVANLARMAIGNG